MHIILFHHLPSTNQAMDLATIASSGNIELLESLINNGADVNQRSREGFLPLCNAAFWGYSSVVEHLLQNGADINLSNSGSGWTACHCAAFQAHGKVLMKLMHHKPNLTIRDSQGRSASDFASALDTMWPFFAAEGCSRTPKAELIKLGIVKKVADYDPAVHACKSDVAYFSRPGSAYVMESNPERGNSTNHMLSAAQTGDVLCFEEEPISNPMADYSPKFSIWKN